MRDSLTAIRRVSSATYPGFPYSPPEPYPELSPAATDPANHVYASVRQLLLDLGLDHARAGKPTWNPFGDFVKPGHRVLIKPNWVTHRNARHPDSLDALITHPAILRPILDYLILALDGRGTITIADAPLQSCNFAELLELLGITKLIGTYSSQYPSLHFEVIDLRKTVLARESANRAGTNDQHAQNGDPQGYTLVDLGSQSLLTDLDGKTEQFRVTNYDHRLLHEHHAPGKHEYLIATSILEADCIINLPKMKCHVKAGLTAALKNLVGINGHKEYLPHHTNGSLSEGGDQYLYPSRFKQWYNRVYDRYWQRQERSPLTQRLQWVYLTAITVLAQTLSRDPYLDGGWFGNDTIPRTTLDLNHILLFYDRTAGTLSSTPVRTVFHLIDGVTAGEGSGPLLPDPKDAGVLIAGTSPLSLDTAVAVLMGYQPMAIPTLAYGHTHRKSRLFDPNVPSYASLSVLLDGDSAAMADLPNLHFRKPPAWLAAEAPEV